MHLKNMLNVLTTSLVQSHAFEIGFKLAVRLLNE